MPEGPSIVILKEEVQRFSGKKVIGVSGNSKIGQSKLLNQKITAFESFGKQFLICFNGFFLRIHLLMFGSYRINEKKGTPERLSLVFPNGELNFYACSVRIIEGDVREIYDFSSDVMQDEWNPRKANAKLKKAPDELICDALLDQDIFSGVGNIIKNEVLYRVRVHPESAVKNIPPAKLSRIIKEARLYSFQFLEWKKKFELKKHWLAHTRKTCLRCNLPIIKKYTGKRKRRSFICTNCQPLYT